MKQDINVLMTKPEMEKILKAGAEISKLGELLSKVLIPLEGLKISIPDVCKIDLLSVSTKTGTDYKSAYCRINEDLEFIPTCNVRLEIDWEN
ncbi:hypothetical protein [Chryseobacterium cucumeris]|uniref:hypothetical protein n=1 Tax=Chryseobacterium cucumeris TaxID=1813611 RepID=UPI00192E1A6E|nr:hypothetical protein [Chryseobacterium cucumeris]QRA44310.1 hypothetical protein JNG87_06030 [Chryseobacterium cucumeris]